MDQSSPGRGCVLAGPTQPKTHFQKRTSPETGKKHMAASWGLVLYVSGNIFKHVK